MGSFEELDSNHLNEVMYASDVSMQGRGALLKPYPPGSYGLNLLTPALTAWHGIS